MQKVFIGILMLTMFFCFVGCGNTVRGENATITTTTDNTVYFKPNCPECGHIGYSKSINLCEGENYNTRYQCEHCFEFYDLSLNR